MDEAPEESREIMLINKRGLHARASAKVVELSERFSCNARIRYDGEIADPCSIMDLLTLAAPNGAVISVSASGSEATAYLDALETLIAARFGEED